MQKLLGEKVGDRAVEHIMEELRQRQKELGYCMWKSQ